MNPYLNPWFAALLVWSLWTNQPTSSGPREPDRKC
jgi:hypothetical protein